MASFPTVRAGVANVPMPQANADWQRTVSGLFGDYAAGQQYGRERDIQQGTQQLLGQAGPNPNLGPLAIQLLGLGNDRAANVVSNLAQNQEMADVRRQEAAQRDYWRGQELDLRRQQAAGGQGYGPAARYDVRPVMNPDGSQTILRIDKFTGEATPVQQPGAPGAPAAPVTVAPKPQAARPLPSAAINNLTEAGATATTLDNIAGGFKPDFAGQPWTGDLWNYVGRTYGGDSQPQAEWWQQYQAQKNVLRNKLFGSALTATEKGEFEKADINPGMKPDVIQANLNRQRAAAQAAARKIAAGYLRSGYPADAIEGALGIPLGSIGVSPSSAPTPQGQPQRPAAAGSLVPGTTTVNGYVYRGGNPNDPASWEQQ